MQCAVFYFSYLKTNFDFFAILKRQLRSTINKFIKFFHYKKKYITKEFKEKFDPNHKQQNN